MKVKICGITNAQDAIAAVQAGADALGFVFAPSPRQVTPGQAVDIIRNLPPFITRVGVVVDQDVESILHECALDVIQFHGSESPDQLARVHVGRRIKAFRIRSEADLEELALFREVANAFLLDTFVEGQAGGTGQSFPWALARSALNFGRPVILAGGLTPENVGEAIRAAWPYAVDVSSGVEASPGRKSRSKLVRFVRAVHEARLH